MKWSLRNNNNYEQTGLLVSLNYFATNRHQFLQNFYEKSKRSILKAKTEGPAAYVLPADDPRPGAQAELLQHSAEAARGDLARDGAVHGDGAGRGRAPRRGRRSRRTRRHGDGAAARDTLHAAPATETTAVPGRQLHRPHGPAVLAHRRRAARLSVLVT